MDLAGLQAFVAVADTGSFSEAGARLHLTQPAVSKRIAALEAQLGAPLFDRIGRGIAPTEAGRALLPRARRILGELDDARRLLDTLGATVGGRLSLATSHHVGLHRLPPALRAFTRAHPQVALDLRFLDSDAACEDVLHGHSELAVVTLAPQLAPALRGVPVWDDPLEFVAAPDHPLAGRDRLALADVARHPAVLPDPGTFTHRIVADLFAREGLAPDLRMTTNHLETIKMLAATGLAWSVLPGTMLDAQLATLPLPGVRLSRRLGYVVHAGRTLSNAARAFLETLETVEAAGAAARR